MKSPKTPFGQTTGRSHPDHLDHPDGGLAHYGLFDGQRSS